MIVLWIVRLLKGCSNSLLAKVFHNPFVFSSVLAFTWIIFSTVIDWFVFCFAVTVVESGTRALQYLGLDGDTSSIGFDVSNFSIFLV